MKSGAPCQSLQLLDCNFAIPSSFVTRKGRWRRIEKHALWPSSLGHRTLKGETPAVALQSRVQLLGHADENSRLKEVCVRLQIS